MNVKQTTKGFTIIEVVLVLAIAGLIFLMVFIALPALQSGQRDASRKTDMSIISTSLTNYVSQNKNTFPAVSAAGNTSFQGYIKGLSSNTTLANVKLASYAATASATEGAATVYLRAKCGGPAATASQYTLTSGKSREFAIGTYLEGGNGIAYCLDGSI